MKKFVKNIGSIILLSLIAMIIQPVDSHAVEDDIIDEIEQEGQEQGDMMNLSDDSDPDSETMDPEIENLTVQYWTLNEDGIYKLMNTAESDVQVGQTLKDAGITLPEMNNSFMELTQIGWMDASGNPITEDWTRGTDSWGFPINYVSVFAKYNKAVASVHYNYPDTNGNWKETFLPIIYEHGEDPANVENKAMEYIPADILKEYSFSHWNQISLKTENGTNSGNIDIVLNASFSNVTSIKVLRLYFDEKGGYGYHNIKFMAVPTGTKYGDVIKMLENDPPQMYPGLRLQGWTLHTGNTDDAVTDGRYCELFPVYENCLVRYIINAAVTDIKKDDAEGGTVFCQLAEKGDTVNAMTSFKGFGEITWVEEGDRVGTNAWGTGAPAPIFEVNDHIKFYGTADPLTVDSNQSSTSSGSKDDEDKITDTQFPNDETDQNADGFIPVENKEHGQNGNTLETNEYKSVKTGNYDTVIPWLLLAVSALGVMVYIRKFSQHSHR